MAWIQMFLQFIADIAWPVVALIVLFAFREGIGSLLLRLKKLIYKDTVLQFANIVTIQKDTIQTKDKQDSIETKNLLAVTEQDCTYDKYLTLLHAFALMAGVIVLQPTKERWYSKERWHYEFAQDILKGANAKIEKERPDSPWLKPARMLEKQIEAAGDKHKADN